MFPEKSRHIDRRMAPRAHLRLAVHIMYARIKHGNADSPCFHEQIETPPPPPPNPRTLHIHIKSVLSSGVTARYNMKLTT